MYDNSDKSSPVQASYFVHGYSPWSPKGLVRGPGRSAVASLVLGVLALVLSITSTLSFVAWIAALLGVGLGLMLLFPRVTSAQRVMSGIGIAVSLIAVAVLVS